MKKALKIFAAVCSISFLFACTTPEKGSSSDSDIVATGVAATLTALSQQAPTTEQEPGAAETVLQATLTPSATFTPTPEVSDTPTSTPVPKPGTVAGAISGYPYGSLPSLVIVAYQQEAPYNYSYYITTAGTAYFSIGGEYVIPGTWQVVAYDASGNSGGCTALVTVKSEETVNCDISDWVSAFRAKPGDIPNP